MKTSLTLDDINRVIVGADYHVFVPGAAVDEPLPTIDMDAVPQAVAAGDAS